MACLFQIGGIVSTIDSSVIVLQRKEIMLKVWRGRYSEGADRKELDKYGLSILRHERGKLNWAALELC